jgi:tRNA modification GTPase
MFKSTRVSDKDQETIIAQCTPKGSGAIALLRMSGEHAITIATDMSKLASGKHLRELPSHTIHFGYVVNAQGEHIDQVMFLLMHGPKTFTGQNVIEITCHNNPFIIEAIIQRALECGARLAQEGEFTKRAYLNNKIDLIQAEAIHELIHANTQQALKKSLAQLEGSFSNHITKLEDELYKALALSEASFEFLDEEMEFGAQIRTLLEAVISTIQKLKKNFDQQQHIRQGIRIALIGAVNAGKSSLFNALLQKERAIVTDIAGTTRDVIEAGLYKDGTYWTLIDTAGLRQTDDIIEQEGIKRSFSEAQLADIVLLVYDSGREITETEHDVYATILTQHAHKVIIVRNKTDLPSRSALVAPHFVPIISSSTKDSSSIIFIERAIREKIDTLLKEADAPFLLNQRQFKLLLGLEKHLCEILPMLNKNVQYELISYHLREALEHLAELTGKTVSERGMDTIFREFCIGK